MCVCVCRYSLHILESKYITIKCTLLPSGINKTEFNVANSVFTYRLGIVIVIFDAFCLCKEADIQFQCCPNVYLKKKSNYPYERLTYLSRHQVWTWSVCFSKLTI